MKKTSPPKAALLGEEDQAFIMEHLKGDVPKLLFKYGQDPVKRKLIEQIASRQAIRKKLPEFYEDHPFLLPAKRNLEQCSSAAVAQLKADHLPKGKTLVDLSGGFGIDFRYLMKGFDQGHFVEPDLDLISLSRRHLETKWPQKGLHFHALKAETFLAMNGQSFDLVYIDPSRRNELHKPLYAIEEYQPDLTSILPQIKTLGSALYAKLSPMIPIEAYLESLEGVSEVWIISERNECKEVGFFWKPNHHPVSPLFRCWDIQNQGLSYYQAEKSLGQACPIGNIEEYLYLPNSSILKAGLQDLLSAQLKLNKLDANSQIFSSAELVENFPGRIFRVKSLHKAYDSKLKKSALQVISRNFPDKPEQIQAKLKLQTKNASDFLIATTQQGKGIFILCEWLVHSIRSNGE